MTEKNFLDYVSDWFRILLKSGIPALLIGLGWVPVFFGSFFLNALWASNPAFWVATGSGLLMIALGFWLHKRQLNTPQKT